MKSQILLHLSYIISKFHILSMFVIVDLQVIFCTQCIDMFIVHTNIKFHLPESKIALLIFIKLRDRRNVCMVSCNIVVEALCYKSEGRRFES
jgi:hypothetical protein